MEGEVECGRDDERHRLRGQNRYLEDQMEQARHREGDDDTTSAGDMEARAPLNPGAAMPRQMAERHSVIGDKVRQDRDFRGDRKRDDVVNAM